MMMMAIIYTLLMSNDKDGKEVHLLIAVMMMMMIGNMHNYLKWWRTDGVMPLHYQLRGHH